MFSFFFGQRQHRLHRMKFLETDRLSITGLAWRVVQLWPLQILLLKRSSLDVRQALMSRSVWWSDVYSVWCVIWKRNAKNISIKRLWSRNKPISWPISFVTMRLSRSPSPALKHNWSANKRKQTLWNALRLLVSMVTRRCIRHYEWGDFSFSACLSFYLRFDQGDKYSTSTPIGADRCWGSQPAFSPLVVNETYWLEVCWQLHMMLHPCWTMRYSTPLSEANDRSILVGRVWMFGGILRTAATEPKCLNISLSSLVFSATAKTLVESFSMSLHSSHAEEK